MGENEIRKENSEILERWYKSFKNFEKLDITGAKELNTLMLNEKDENKKLQLREKLIYGTLYTVYKFLKNSEFLDFKSSSYTMDDIISETVNYLINNIDEGNILKISFLSGLFTRNYYVTLCNKLMGENQNTLLTVEGSIIFQKILVWYFELKDSGYDIDFNNFEPYVKSTFNFKNKKSNIFDYIDLYNGLNGFYEYCQNNNIDTHDKAKISKQYVDFIINIGNNITKENSHNEPVMEDDLFEKTFFEEMKQTLIDLLNLGLIDDRAKNIIYMRYGLNGEKYTLRQVAKYFHISQDRVRDIENKTLRFLRRAYRYNMHLNKEHDKVLMKWRSYNRKY